jgi:hypothetical protein
VGFEGVVRESVFAGWRVGFGGLVGWAVRLSRFVSELRILMTNQNRPRNRSPCIGVIQKIWAVSFRCIIAFIMPICFLSEVEEDIFLGVRLLTSQSVNESKWHVCFVQRFSFGIIVLVREDSNFGL